MERANRTLQDRLVKELRLENVCDMDAGNERFALPSAKPENLHRPLNVKTDRLNDILCHREQRYGPDRDRKNQVRNAAGLKLTIRISRWRRFAPKTYSSRVICRLARDSSSFWEKIVVDIDLGKTTFAQLTEYPLPINSGIKDYVFYFAPDTDGYGQGALFFNAFYPNHVKNNVTSLEALIDTLQTEVGQNGVTLIREIGIVAHGNSQALLFPVVNGASSTNLPELQCLTALSIAQLQRDIFAGKSRRSVDQTEGHFWLTYRTTRGYEPGCFHLLISRWADYPNPAPDPADWPAQQNGNDVHCSIRDYIFLDGGNTEVKEDHSAEDGT